MLRKERADHGGRVATGAFLIGSFEVSRWRSARQGAPYGHSIVAVIDKINGGAMKFSLNVTVICGNGRFD
jgi:hypothetical protein